MDPIQKNKEDKKRAIIITSAVHLLLLLIFIFFGLGYQDPAPRVGYVINFGSSEHGFGKNEDGAQAAQKVNPQPPVKSDDTQSPDQSDQTIRTQSFTDAPSVDSQSSKKINSDNTDKPAKQTEPEPSNDLTKLLQNVEATKNGGDGDDQTAGDKGKKTGDINSTSYDGNSNNGAGGNGNYNLGNRRVINKGDDLYPCEDEGRVVVEIKVDQNGKVIRATAGVKYNGKTTTTTSDCLFKLAKSKALKTTWQADASAPDQQKGYIIYNFFKS